MSAAANDLYLGQGQQRAARLAQPIVKRTPLSSGSGSCGRHRHGENGVGAKLRFGWRPIKFDKLAVEARTVTNIKSDQRRSNFTMDVGDGVEDRFAAKARWIAVAQFGASNCPVEAPDGTVPRPRSPLSNSISASTVGLPRES